MATAHAVHRGSVVALWRYPVKSMIGEELNASDVTERGLLGDRAYALVDAETGMVVSAKNPRKWGNMFDFRAAFVAPPRDPGSLPPARITFPDGAQVTTDQADVDRRLSASMGRPVRLAASVPDAPILEGYWPEHEWLPNPDQVFEVAMPSGTFFDLAVVHLITTATLERLRDLAPEVLLRGPSLPAQPRDQSLRWGRGVRGGRMDRPDAFARGRGPTPHHATMPALHHDNPEPGGPAQGRGHPSDRGPAQPGLRRRLRLGP